MIYSYRRVSTTEQHNGPEAQIDAIRRYLSGNASLALAQPGADFFDDGVSGSVALSDRRQGAAMLRLLAPGDTVVILKLDRLFRSVADAALTMDEWCKRDIKLVSITEGFDMTTPYGKAMAHIMSAMAELERSMIGERTKAALAAKKARGERTGQVPYGSDLVDGLLVPNLVELTTIGVINEMSKAGVSSREIVRYLNQSNIHSKRGGKWHRRIVESVLSRFDKA